MPLEKIVDPRTKKTLLLVSGEVEGVFFNELKNPKSYTNPNTGKAWQPTHAVTLVVDKLRVNLGLTDRDNVRAKDTDDEYQDVIKGAEVSVEVKEEKWERNGKSGVNYTARTSDIIVTKVGQATPAPNNASRGSTGATNYQKRDDLPIRIGNAITAASFMAARAKGVVEFEKVLEKANEILPIVDEVRKVLKEEYPKMDDYSLGARLGQCVVVASQHYVKKPEDFADVLPDMFAQVCALEDDIRNPPKEDAPEEYADSPEDFEMDSDIPF
jgi:CBS domain-containing protein